MLKLALALILTFATPSFAAQDNELKVTIKNNAGYPIHHLSVTRVEQYPELDILEKPLQDGEAVDFFVAKDKSTNLLLWMFNEDYSSLTVELGDQLANTEYVEIQNDGSLKFYLKDDDTKYLTKQKKY